MLRNVLSVIEAVLGGVLLSQRLRLEILRDSAERCVPVVLRDVSLLF